MSVITPPSMLDLEINDILNAPAPFSGDWEYSVMLHTKVDDFQITLLETIEYMRDYKNNVTDYIVVNFRMGMGDFIKRIVPLRDNLEMTITINKNGVYDVKRYKFVMLNNNKNLFGNAYNKASQESLNQIEQVIIEGQCLERDVEALRTVYTDGVYNNVTVKDVMLYSLKKASDRIKVGSQSPDLKIRMEEPNNQRIYDHIEIPVGINIFDLPFYLHETKYGVYNAGIGMYFQVFGEDNEKSMFIYPLMDPDKFDRVDKKMMIYSEGTDKYAIADNTFSLDGDIIKIVAAEVVNLDDGENKIISQGNGMIVTDPNKLLERDTIVSDTGITVDKTTHMEGSKAKEKNDNVDLGRYMGTKTNQYILREAYIRNMMSAYQITWNHSVPDYIYPGMPVMFIIEDESLGMIKLKGIIQSHYSRYNAATKTMSTLINILVEKPIVKDPKEKYDEIVEMLKENA